MNDEYKLGYENGRLGLIEELKLEVIKARENYFNTGSYDDFEEGAKEAIGTVFGILITKQEEMENVHD
jgi:hypothetical protein